MSSESLQRKIILIIFHNISSLYSLYATLTDINTSPLSCSQSLLHCPSLTMERLPIT